MALHNNLKNIQPPNWAVKVSNSQLDQLVDLGFLVVEDCFDQAMLAALQTESGYIDYREANLTQGVRIASIRGDSIRWLDDSCPSGMVYLHTMSKLADFFNQILYTGIRHTEAHYARYPAGFGYQWHTDNPSGRDERVLSAVFYLNDDWQPSDGGEIVLIDKLGQQQTLSPKANRLLVFDSNLQHQVNITHRERFSIATWLRKDNAIL